MELTKEHFDQQLKKFVTKEYFDKQLGSFVTKKYFDEQIGTIKVDVDSLKSGLSSVKSELGSVRSDLEILSNKVDAHYVDLKADTRSIRQTVEQHNKRNLADIDAFASSWVQHDRQIKRLKRTAKIAKLKSKSS